MVKIHWDMFFFFNNNNIYIYIHIDIDRFIYILYIKWWFLDMGVPPKWMVYKGKSQTNMNDLGVPLF